MSLRAEVKIGNSMNFTAIEKEYLCGFLVSKIAELEDPPPVLDPESQARWLNQKNAADILRSILIKVRTVVP